MRRIRGVALPATLALFSVTAWSQTSAAIRGVAFHIEKQPVRKALRQWAEQSGLQVVFSDMGSALDQKVAQSVSGEHAPEVALKQMLAATDLEYEFVTERVVRISATLGETAKSKKEKVKDVDRPQAVVANGPQPIRLAQADNVHSSKSGPNDEDAASGVQMAGAGIPEVLVKGSRILNFDIRRSRDDAQPYVVFSRTEIERSGARNIEEFLRSGLAANTSAGSNAQTGPSVGTRSQINLRGLGTEQTLILIDGRRAVSPVFQGSPDQPDVNGIPLSAVERIEVLPTTASGIYGGGATGGVVNIVLRRDYSGLEARVAYGNSFDAGAPTRQVDLSAGINLEEGRTNILIAGTYSNSDPLATRDRELVQRGRAAIIAANPASTTIFGANPPLGATPNIRSATTVNGMLENLTLKEGNIPLNSTFTHIPLGYAGTDSDGGAALVENAGTYNLDLPDTAQALGGGLRSLMGGPTLKSLTLTVRREFAPRLQAFITGSSSRTDNEYIASALTGTFNMPANAPGNPFNQAIRVTVPIKDGDVVLNSPSEDLRLVGGVIIQLPRNWSAGVDYTWHRAENRFLGTQSLMASAANAVNSGALPVLVDLQAFPTDFSSFLNPRTTNKPFVSTLKNPMARVAGPAISLPAGSITISGMVERREEFFDESAVLLPDGSPFSVFPSKSQIVESVYLEARVPLASDQHHIRGIRELELQLAGRYDDYTTHGVTNSVSGPTQPVRATGRQRSANPTFGIKYRPLRDVMLRTSYSGGFLPPSVLEMAPIPTTTPIAITDPKRGGESTIVAAGQILTGGNPNLKPEQSESWSIGLVFTPRLLDGFRMSVDYTRIDKRDEIRSVPGGNQGVVNNEDLLQSRITRGQPEPGDPFGVGPIVRVDATLINLARTSVRAFDVSLDQHASLGRLGSIDVFAFGTWHTHYRTQLLPNSPVVENVGSTSAFPLKFRGSAGVSWRKGPWAAGWSARYFDSYRLIQDQQIADQGNGGAVPSQIYHDVFARYQFSGEESLVPSILKNTDIQLTIKNVFNKDPPVDVSNTISLYSLYGDPRLATYLLSMRRAF